MIKCTAIFVLLAALSSAAMAQTPYYSVECLYEWTLNCERLKMEEERAHREQMLEEMKRQNRILQQQADQEKRAFQWRNLD
jgi:mannosyltransferase OCH1-like enzyme